MKLPEELSHPKGETPEPIKKPNYLLSDESKLAVDTFGGRVHVEWDPQSSVTPLGQLPFFIEFLKLGNLLEPWIEDCPLHYTSSNAPSKRDILGTLLLSILSGHHRYAHVTTIRCDHVNPSLLGMDKIVSEDSLRRGLLKIKEEEGIAWLQNHFYKCYQPLLDVPWVLDIDTTVKPLYGKQEGAVVGYNPKKPGRPSHTYHTFSLANLRLVLDVEVQAGNEMAASYTSPDLWSLLERIPKHQWPEFIRGDCAFGTDGVMHVAEQKGVPYLFKIKQTKNVKRLIEKLMLNRGWTNAGQGWEGQESDLKLMGWSKSRRVIVLRKRISKDLAALKEDPETKQLSFDFAELDDGKVCIYEYAVLVTSLPDEVLTIAQHYRDRADSENIFDELKNQWGWGGFTTQDLKRCRLTARSVGLVYNWWNLFVRLADPQRHLEAITSRPLLLHAVGKQTSHAGQTFIKITSTHGKLPKVKMLLNRIASFFKLLKDAEQLSSEQRWYAILSKALEKYLNGRLLQPPILIPTPG
jgi:Transposase DDE domain group 1